MCASFAWAEDGSRLWLRLGEAAAGGVAGNKVVSNSKSPTASIAVDELTRHWQGKPVELVVDEKLQNLKDGYKISSNERKITISAAGEAGLLYGAYHLLRLQETGADAANPSAEEIPSYDRRILNHWDNLDGSIERGYAGQSLWRWSELPQTLSPRYKAYARANASVGINGTVLNNVNANPKILTPEYLAKVKALADVFRPYGLTVYLSVNFAAPKTIGGLPTADPLNRQVARWWREKVKEIYALIPDFGGFLVKANSEGQSGPQDYGRTHADGANMLADVLKPYKGIVMWRAFVYNPTKEDRAKQAYQEFVPLDGKFRDNVIIQIKNGPVDFQPREPFSPLFGALRHTQEMVELQITQEYLGHSTQLVYLAPLFEEALQSDTYSDGQGSTVAKITDGALRPAQVTAIAGVANTGDNASWCGHQFAQANWYAFGRLAWNNSLSAGQIADEWIRMTFSSDPRFVAPVKDLMMTSREACVSYMMPYGLHHIFSFNHHYGPGPWDDIPGGRPDWMPWYYHNADSGGVGFDRTAAGSNAVAQYFAPLNEIYGDAARCPEDLLLWFHHVAWTHQLKNGVSLWNNMCCRYDEGVQAVREYGKTWDKMKPYVDEQRFREVQAKLKTHAEDALIWKDACLLYFQTFSKMPIPGSVEPPVYTLEELKQLEHISLRPGKDSVYLSAFTTGSDGLSGLQLAWSIDGKNGQLIGGGHAFLRSDYGAWGSEKRMFDPQLFADANGLWRCIFDVNRRDSVAAHTVSDDLILWKPQTYLLKRELEAYVAKIPLRKQPGNSACKVSMETVNALERRCIAVRQKNRLYGESAAQDSLRFAGLESPTATLTVDFTQTKKISDKLIGVFFEDISYAADGGLYAELVQNRDFEYSPKSGKGWHSFYAWRLSGQNDGVEFRIDTLQPLHPNNPHYAYLNLHSHAPDLALENTGWDGIALKKGEAYELSFFAAVSAEKFRRSAVVQLIGEKNTVVAEKKIKFANEKWKKYTLVLSASEQAENATLRLKISEPGWYKLDMISLFPKKTFKNRKNGLRADLAQAIADIHPRFVRFPGGCVAHGNGIENIYSWKHSTGSLEERTPDRNLWGYHQTKGLGYYEYFLFCEDIGAEPLPVLAAGVPCQNSDKHGRPLAGQQGGVPMDEMDEYIQDILDLIAWANGDANGDAWAKKRAEAGHPEPFNLKYIGIGNEDLISDVFKERFEMIYRAVREKHPEITVIGTAGPFYEGSDYTFGWEFASALGVPMVDEHYYVSPAWFIHNQDFYDRYDRSKPKVYLGEYAAHVPGRANNIETALAEALHLCNVERNGDVVALTSYAPLLAKEKHTQWNPDLIYFTNTEVKPTVGYEVQKLFGNNAGDEYIAAATEISSKRQDGRRRIASSVVRDTKTGDVIIKLVNMLPVAAAASISLNGAYLANASAVKTVLQGKPDDKNAKPTSAPVAVAEPLAVDLPAYSFTLIRLQFGTHYVQN
jgi:alpha-glucuronidase